ncbi:MAG: hypothetical protein ACYST6_17220, partial [Planctomycetota bacterium]
MPTYSEYMQGGVLASGVAPNYSYAVKLRDDGCYCGVSYTESPSGGAVCSGSAVVDDGIFRGSGGAVCSGSAVVDNLMDPWDGVEASWPLFELANGTTG